MPPAVKFLGFILLCIMTLKFDIVDCVCVLCTPQVRRRQCTSRGITKDEEELYYDAINQAKADFPKRKRGICEACHHQMASDSALPVTPHWDSQRKSFNKTPGEGKLFDSPSESSGSLQPKSLDFLDTPAKKKQKASGLFSLIRKACHRIWAQKPPFWAVSGPELPT